MQVEQARRDDCCTFGKWIHAPGKFWDEQPERCKRLARPARTVPHHRRRARARDHRAQGRSRATPHVTRVRRGPAPLAPGARRSQHDRRLNPRQPRGPQHRSSRLWPPAAKPPRAERSNRMGGRMRARAHPPRDRARPPPQSRSPPAPCRSSRCQSSAYVPVRYVARISSQAGVSSAARSASHWA